VAVAALVVLSLVWADSGWYPLASLFGKYEARVDIAHGRYKEFAWGLPFRGADVYARLLRERYDIEFHYVDYCTAPKSMRDYAEAYDEVSSAAVKRKFGRDVFQETYGEAVKNWKLANPAKAAN
jgi:hypothetical protein